MLTVKAVLEAADNVITSSEIFCRVRIEAAQAIFRPANSSSSALAYLYTTGIVEDTATCHILLMLLAKADDLTIAQEKSGVSCATGSSDGLVQSSSLCITNLSGSVLKAELSA